MNHDRVELERKAMARQDDGAKSPTIFAQLRNFSSRPVTSLGSLFNSASPNACPNSGCDSERLGYDTGFVLDPEAVVTPTPTRSPTPHGQRRFPDVKRIFSFSRKPASPQPHLLHVQIEDLAGTAEGNRIATPPGESSCYMSPYSDSASSVSDEPHDYTQQTPLSASESYTSSSEPDETPPLTPESLVTDLLEYENENAHRYQEQYEYDDHYGYQRQYEYQYEGGLGGGRRERELEDAYMPSESMDAENLDLRPHSLEIKEGKRPQRAICYDALLEDISVDASTNTGANAELDIAAFTDVAPENDKDEWYGLEYTLELSTRERRASDTHSFSGGEHSKSRESWAAIHQGTIHPFFEDEEYYQWKSWHRALERQDERRRHRRGRAFKASAKELAWYYSEEVHTRDLAAQQMVVYGEVEKAVDERLRILAQHRPDPFHPPVKHDEAWHLKRWRSVASLRELRTLPEVTLQLAATT